MNNHITNFFDRDETGSSIGSGSSDQGLEPGTESQEDEFRKNKIHSSPGSAFNEEPTVKGNENSKNKSKGLVEEGPGPDS